jgi:hypothetical protein
MALDMFSYLTREVFENDQFLGRVILLVANVNPFNGAHTELVEDVYFYEIIVSSVLASFHQNRLERRAIIRYADELVNQFCQTQLPAILPRTSHAGRDHVHERVDLMYQHEFATVHLEGRGPPLDHLFFTDDRNVAVRRKPTLLQRERSKVVLLPEFAGEEHQVRVFPQRFPVRTIWRLLRGESLTTETVRRLLESDAKNVTEIINRAADYGQRRGKRFLERIAERLLARLRQFGACLAIPRFERRRLR